MNISKHRFLFFGFSLLFIIPGVISLILFGVKPGIDFTGGSLIEFQFTEQVDLNQVNAETLQQTAPNNLSISSVQQSGEKQVLVRANETDNDTVNQLVATLSQQFGEVSILRFETVGPILGRELLVKTLTAVAIVSVLITLYVWKQFSEWKYGVAAILAMFHDSLILLGIFSILGRLFDIEVDVLFVTALLTTLSFSVHDTIVVFDRIRELRRKHGTFSFSHLVNAAVLETLGRSINNSLTIMIMLVALAVLGGESIRIFALALLIGSISGTYSSTFTAVPLLLVFHDWQVSKQK